MKTRQPLTRDRIVEAALALADREGPGAVTMRRLGRELDVEGMAIYGHFASKEELLGGVAARVLSELDLRPRRGATWETRVRHVVSSWARLRDRHPGGFPLLYARRDWARQEFEPIEEILDALREAGLPPARAALVYQTLVWLLDGILLSSGYTEEPIRRVWEHGLEIVDRDAFPRYVEAAPHAAKISGRKIFDFGVELLIRGLRDLVEGESSPIRKAR